jgi:hypothetical protein
VKYLGFAVLFLAGPPLLVALLAVTWTVWVNILEFIIQAVRVI